MMAASVIAAAAAWAVARACAGLVGGVGGSVVQVGAGGVVGLAIAVGLGTLLGVSEVSVALGNIKRIATRSRKRDGE